MWGLLFYIPYFRLLYIPIRAIKSQYFPSVSPGLSVRAVFVNSSISLSSKDPPSDVVQFFIISLTFSAAIKSFPSESSSNFLTISGALLKKLIGSLLILHKTMKIFEALVARGIFGGGLWAVAPVPACTLPYSGGSRKFLLEGLRGGGFHNTLAISW